MSADDYSVDTDLVADLVERMSQCESTLEQVTNDVERSVVDLQGTWHGEAAEAQRLAHAEWEKGLTTMREAIAELRDLGRGAHENYQAVIEANLAMWQSAQGS